MTATLFAQATALHREGRTADAARLYDEVLCADAHHLGALVQYGSLRLGEGLPGEAETLLRRAIATAPASVEGRANLGAALQAQGRYESAIAEFELALAGQPGLIDARFGLAACLQAAGRRQEALACYTEMLRIAPAHPEANYGLAVILAASGRGGEAASHYRAALAADPDFAEANCALGKLLLATSRPHDAVDCLLQALDVDPGYIEARIALGTALSRLFRDDAAMAAFRLVLAAAPDDADAHVGIGILLDRARRHADAIAHFRLVLASRPKHVDAMAGLAAALKNTLCHDEALALAREVLAARPDHPPALALLGSILAETGDIDAAAALFRQAVDGAPGRPDYAYYLTELSRMEPGDAVVPSLQAMLQRAADYPVPEQCLLHFALGKALDDVGRRDDGFDQLLRGNAIKRGQLHYDEAATLSGLRRVAGVFTPALLGARAGQGDPSDVPVFVVGMPRSGTTLVEQILASHEQVHGAGERSDLPRAIGLFDLSRVGGVGFPDAVTTLKPAALREIGAAYVASIRPLAPDARRIVDKLPANFALVGLIRLILPAARIIHVSRDPVDTCLSCFSKLFSGEQDFSYDLAELGRYHRGYQRLMAHWRAVLPAETLLEVAYEALVDDVETQARRMIAHCGLAWDPACLTFHRTARPVHTASLVQVRQPIYRHSVGRWRPGASLLQPLLDGLAG